MIRLLTGLFARLDTVEQAIENRLQGKKRDEYHANRWLTTLVPKDTPQRIDYHVPSELVREQHVPAGSKPHQYGA